MSKEHRSTSLPGSVNPPWRGLHWITALLQLHPSSLSGMLVLEGSPGSGKTLLLEEWLTSLTTHDPSPAISAHHILAKKQETPAQFARRLAQDLGWSSSARSTSELWNEAASALTYASVDLLIIDQAEHLSLILAQCIRSYLFYAAARWLFLSQHHLAPRSCSRRPDPCLAHDHRFRFLKRLHRRHPKALARSLVKENHSNPITDLAHSLPSLFSKIGRSMTPSCLKSTMRMMYI
jgi:hypothetical protein